MMARSESGVFFSPPGRCDAYQQDGGSRDQGGAIPGVEAIRQTKPHRSGERALPARESAAVAPLKARRLSPPPSLTAGQKGARLQMQRKQRRGGHAWIASVRRGPAALVLAAVLAYNGLGCSGLVPAFKVDIHAQLSLTVRQKGEPERDGGSRDQGGAIPGVEAIRQTKPHRSGERALPARESAAVAPIRNRTTGGATTGCGELV